MCRRWKIKTTLHSPTEPEHINAVMIRFKLFDAEETPLEVFNGKAIIDQEIQFVVDECETDEVEEAAYTFPGYVSSYMRIYNERLGLLIRTIVLSQSGGSLIVNASVADMTFDATGNYWYEIGYLQSGGYEIALRYGILKVVWKRN